MSTYNLTSTILGAGILSLPFAFRESGIVMGILMLVMTAVISNFSCGLVLSAYVWTHKASYGDLAKKIYGHKAQIVVETIVMLLNIGACAAYMLVVKELMPPALAYVFPSAFERFSDKLLTAILVFGVVLPLCCLRDISSLRFTSMLAFGFAVFLVVAIVVRSIQDLVRRHRHGERVFCDVAYESDGALGVFRALPLFAFSYICHLNVLPVYEFLRSRSPARMRTVFGLAMVFATCIYVLAGTFGSLRFCDKTPGDILGFPGNGENNCGHFPRDDVLITVARLAQTLTCTLALPLIALPTRLALHALVVDHIWPLLIRCCCAAYDDEEDGNEYTSMNESSSRSIFPRVSTDQMANLHRLGRSPLTSDDENRKSSDRHAFSPVVSADTPPSPSSPEGRRSRRQPRTPMKEPLLDIEDSHEASREERSETESRVSTCDRILRHPSAVQFYESSVIIGISFLIAMLVPGVNVAFGLIGSTLCTVVCYILPALFYLGATASHADECKAFSRLHIRRLLSKLLMTYGIVTGVVGTAITVYESFLKSDSDECGA